MKTAAHLLVDGRLKLLVRLDRLDYLAVGSGTIRMYGLGSSQPSG